MKTCVIVLRKEDFRFIRHLMQIRRLLFSIWCLTVRIWSPSGWI